ncbi:MAG: MBL fold metallo-hydrolase [Ignavibacteriaceae bacterium]|nr:MBL fold metallo-hydrolase [Ignavibacteriaceae bacterium]
MFKFLPLGGAGEVGANCYYLNISGTGIILDCGIHPQKTGLEALPAFDLIDDKAVDYVLISHAHQDHIGALPYLVKRHPYIKIIATPQTRALAELTLHNSVAILKQQLKEEDKLEVYTHEEIDLLIQSIEYKAYGEEFILNGYNQIGSNPTLAKFYDAGHILGSAGIYLEHGDDKIFYTGDVNLNKQALLPGANIPDIKTDTLILETTYGGTDSSMLLNWNEESLRLASAINKTIIAGGSILIPVFSLGKTQEVLTTIWDLMNKNKIIQTDIYTGGLADKISRVYDYNRYVVNRIDPEFEISDIPKEDLYEVDNVERFFKNPCIVLAASGMLIEGTASFNLARRWLRQSDSAIFTVGYMAENTPGFKLAGAKKGNKIKLNGSDEEDVKCTVEQFRFSSHSRREELIAIVRKMKPAKVILVHGEPAGINWIGSSILKNNSEVKVFRAEPGKELIL